MAHSLTAALLSKQKTGGTPYIYLVFSNPDGSKTYDYSSDQYNRRIMYIEHTEEPYYDNATIILRNDDDSIPDLRGYWTEIGYGYVTGNAVAVPTGDTAVGGNNSDAEFAKTPRLWVKKQHNVYKHGSSVVILELTGMWVKLQETLLLLGSAPLYTKNYTTDTVESIIQAAATEAGITVNATVNSDGIVDSYQPQFEVDFSQIFENAGNVIKRLINITYSYLRPLVNKKMEFVYPQGTDSYDETYYFSDNTEHQYYDYDEIDNVFIPNKVIAYGNAGDDELWSSYISATAIDVESKNRYEEVTDVIFAANITTQANINNRAAVILQRAKSEAIGGKLLIPHDSRVQLYDRVSVVKPT